MKKPSSPDTPVRAVARRPATFSRSVLALCLVQLAGWAAAAPDVDTAAWAAFLRHRVDARGDVDYRGVGPNADAGDRARLERYLASLAGADPDRLRSPQARLAFWINAYNACAVRGVLDHYPVASVQEIAGFFDGIRYRVAGAELTLDEIEARGRALADGRIHLALVCASAGCPPLRAEAYVAERLEAQLADQARRFLGDREVGLRLSGSTLWVSPIFDWYAEDFVDGKPNVTSLLPVLAPYLDAATADSIRERPLELKYLDYDWSLNEAGSSPR